MSSDLVLRMAQLLRFVGNTRMICTKINGIDTCLKLEYENPTGSHKDRIATYMIKGLLDDGRLSRGDCVAELSSGNTATSIAWAASFLGLRSLLIVKRYVSQLKRSLIRLYGGELIVAEEDIDINKAKEIAEEKGCIFLNQYENEFNFLAHYETTAKEIIDQTKGKLTHFIMGIGTGGTITGVGSRLKEELSKVSIIGVIPKGSALSKERTEKFDVIEGLVSHTVPKLFLRHKNVVDHIVEVTLTESLSSIRYIYMWFSLLPGPSTGASFAAFLALMKNGVIVQGSKVVIIAADQLLRYPNIIERFKLLDL